MTFVDNISDIFELPTDKNILNRYSIDEKKLAIEGYTDATLDIVNALEGATNRSRDLLQLKREILFFIKDRKEFVSKTRNTILDNK
ncbi:MAG: hypothetical protein IPJ79_18650 [Bacteroidetes bacterium]|nr:hypothetical protein [Bacteroidota bacterium]